MLKMVKRKFFLIVSMLAIAACGETASQDTTSSAEEEKSEVVETASVDKAKENEPQKQEGDVNATAEAEDNSHSPSKADAGSEPSDCKIKSHPADAEFKGDCEFVPSGGGSFSVQRSSGEAFVDGITQFILELDTKTAAGFSARSADGELNYLGTAEKSTVDAACWEAENYSVCVYGK
ncbi:hypothetical protein A8B75_04550 [Sphingomonadales bacterium EhC05]|nr:hypothetical protein A8B75_04550 [Sphingomonadales bacterium EhC05]